MPSRRSVLAWALTGVLLPGGAGCAAPVPASPLFSFGVVADVQYADKEGGGRNYRGSLDKAARCVEEWSRHDLAFAVELGDITDDRTEGTKDDLARILGAFQPLKVPLYHVLGNHGQPSAGRSDVMDALGLKRPYDEFERSGWRFVVLDAAGLNLKAWPAGSARRAMSEAYYRENHGKDRPELTEYNGGIDADQLKWLRGTLDRAAGNREPVIVLCHIPVLAEASGPSHLLWNHEEVLAVLESCPTLVAVFAGHDHRGGYAVRKGIHHVTIEGMVETPPDGNAFGIVDVFRDRLAIRGFGALKSRTLEIREDLKR